MILKHWNVANRIRLLVGLMLCGLVALCVAALAQFKDSLQEDRKEKTQNLVEVGMGLLAHYHQLAQEGKISEEEAKTRAR